MKPIYSNFTVMRGKTRLVPHSWIEKSDIVNAVIYNPGHLAVRVEIEAGVGVKFILSEAPLKRVKVHYQINRQQPNQQNEPD